MKHKLDLIKFAIFIFLLQPSVIAQAGMASFNPVTSAKRFMNNLSAPPPKAIGSSAVPKGTLLPSGKRPRTTYEKLMYEKQFRTGNSNPNLNDSKSTLVNSSKATLVNSSKSTLGNSNSTLFRRNSGLTRPLPPEGQQKFSSGNSLHRNDSFRTDTIKSMNKILRRENMKTLPTSP